jgi:hypothetical protein
MQFASVVQVVGQVVPVPLHTNGVQDGVPVAPEERTLHVPSELAPSATVQASQAPAQAVLQHTPSVQKPLVHWSLAVHVLALADFATHWPPSQ